MRHQLVPLLVLLVSISPIPSAVAANLSPQEAEYRALADELLKAPRKFSRSKPCRSSRDPGVRLLCAYARTVVSGSAGALIHAINADRAVARAVTPVDEATSADREEGWKPPFGKGVDFGTDVLHRIIDDLALGEPAARALLNLLKEGWGYYGEAIEDELCRMYVRSPSKVLAQWTHLKRHRIVPPFETSGDCDSEQMRKVLLPIYRRACAKDGAQKETCGEVKRLLKGA